MKLKINYFAPIVLLAAILFSCNNDTSNMRKKITGKAGEMVVVISKSAWEESAGEAIRATLAQPQVALPQEEPLFDVINVPHEAFKDIFKSTRNIIQVNISQTVEKEGVTFTDDVWAYPQATVQIQAKNQDRFVELLNENKDKILSYFLSAERERITMNYKNTYEKSVYNILDKDFGVTMLVPPGFRVMEQKKDFIWIQYDTPDIIQGIVIYTYPFVSDSAFTVDYQLPLRDSILKANVPGPTDGSYMATETRIDPIYNITRHNGNYAGEMRGLWRVANDFMGGPYIALSELDMANQRVINAFGFVYKPNKEKRNLLRQVEAMIYSLKLNNQKENDKLNKQSDFEINVEG
ncbi:DUF4837 family protein [Maribellus sp. YY47]|uniref:DUF4837 family protein n=1 Tax=Maribellus sp. YY47 TaxID=2929486 RepID=UPI00200099FA|nr:DUF4837 family protein [Maribellus sp. YY47]MCK3683961.1 DUF4837 family protein [Maribellus sp. YY47]